MRVLLILFAFAIAFSVVLVVAAQVASAGTADSPELEDAAGDCAVPYGNAYLDVVAAWIEGETPETFDVHLRLAGWEDELAEGSGYSVQFTHQGMTWGIVAVYSGVLTGGWEFTTGIATAELAEGFEDASGSFDPDTSEIVVTFPKAIFPHDDPADADVRGFVAMSADLRPAYPFIAGEEAGLPTESNGRWVVCDEATGAGVYTFAAGHSSAHDLDDASTPPADAAAPTSSGPAEAAPDDELTPQAARNDTPLAAPMALGALAAAALRRR